MISLFFFLLYKYCQQSILLRSSFFSIRFSHMYILFSTQSNFKFITKESRGKMNQFRIMVGLVQGSERSLKMRMEVGFPSTSNCDHAHGVFKKNRFFQLGSTVFFFGGYVVFGATSGHSTMVCGLMELNRDKILI